MMLAEKSADMIMGNTPLAAINEPFYVHKRQGRVGGGRRPGCRGRVRQGGRRWRPC